MRFPGIPACLPAVVVAAFAASSLAGGPALRAEKSAERQAEAFRALDRYLEAAESRHSTAEATVPFRIDAALPKMHKHGVLSGLKVITGAGRVVYTQLHFVGDSIIKNAVIARFLSADTKIRTGSEAAEIAPKNYRLKYKGTAVYGDRTVFVFATEPKQKRVGLFKGELWIDAETARPLREWGEFVKSPSILLRHVYFVRDYASGSADPNARRIIVRLQAAFAGPVELTMWMNDAEARGSDE